MRRRWMLAALAPLAPLAGCGGPAEPDRCDPAEARLDNASALTVEQLYLVPAGTAGWGRDLIGPGGLSPGAGLPVRFSGSGRYRLRAVWVSGRAVEMPDLDGCTIRRITVVDGGLRAE